MLKFSVFYPRYEAYRQNEQEKECGEYTNTKEKTLWLVHLDYDFVLILGLSDIGRNCNRINDIDSVGCLFYG